MSTSSSSTSSYSFTSSSSYEDSSFSLSSSSLGQFSLDEINTATNNFDKERILGEGAEAIVYKAELYLNSKTQKTWVAVKRLNKNSTEFEKEIRIVSKIRYPYVVALHGYCNDSGEKILIYEYMKNGSLSGYVKNKSKICLTWKQRLNICLNAACGLQHLHKETTEFRKGIIHRDMKPANILLDEDWVAKVSDFGMFKVSDSNQIKSTMMTDYRIGTQGYFAPEYFMSYRLSRKADVYAFGVVLFEVLCRKKLWDRGDLTYLGDENEDLGVWARENVDIEIKNDISFDSLKAFTDAIGKCLQEKPEKRATMDDVVESLELAIKCQECQSEDLNTSLTPLSVEEIPSQEAPAELVYERGTSTQPAITLTELQHDYILGNYPVGKDDAAQLSALQILVEIGFVNNPESCTDWTSLVERVLPTQIAISRTKREWEMDILSRYQLMENLTKEDARQQFLQILRTLPYGNSVFFSVLTLDDPIGLLPKRITLGINKRGVHFFCHVWKEYLHTAKLRDIKQFGSSDTAVFFEMRVGGVLHLFKFETEQAEEICVALQTHINNFILSRSSEARSDGAGSVNRDFITNPKPSNVDVIEKGVQDLSNALEESQKNASQGIVRDGLNWVGSLFFKKEMLQ